MGKNIRYELCLEVNKFKNFGTKSKTSFYKLLEPMETTNSQGRPVTLGKNTVITSDKKPTVKHEYLFKSPELFEIRGYLRRVHNVEFSYEETKDGYYGIVYSDKEGSKTTQKLIASKPHKTVSMAYTAIILEFLTNLNKSSNE